MKLKGKFKNLKTGAKRVFVGMLILCILSSATGIGSIFVYADEADEALTNTNTNTDNNNTTIDEHIHTADEQWHSDASGHWHECTAGDGEKMDFSEHTLNWVAESETTEVEKCSVCGYVAGTRTAESEPVVTEPDTVDVAHIHTIESYTSVDAMNHEGTCTDPNCGQTVTAAHNMGDWKKTPDGTQHTRTCALCNYTETHTPDYDDQGVCTICGLTEETNTDTSSTDSIELPKSRSLKSILRSTNTNSELDDTLFNAFFEDNLPAAKTGLEYTGQSQVLVEKKVPSVYEYTVDDVKYKYSQDVIEVDGETCPGDITAKDAGTHTVKYGLKCDRFDAYGLPLGEYTAIKEYTVEIKPYDINGLKISHTVLPAYEGTSKYIDYLSTDNYENAFKLSHKVTDSLTVDLTKGTDYTVTVPTISTPDLTTDPAVYYLTVNGQNNFTGTRTIPIEARPVSFTFDGSTSIGTSYIGDVEIAASGYGVGLSESGDFYSSIKYDTVGSNQYVGIYVKKSDVNKIIRQTVGPITIKDGLTDEEIFTKFLGANKPQSSGDLPYTGADQTLVAYVPYENYSFTEAGKTFTYYTTKIICNREEATLGTDATGKDVGCYEIEYYLMYKMSSDAFNTYSAKKEFTVNITTADINNATVNINTEYKTSEGNINYLSTDDYASAFTLKYQASGSSEYTLIKGTDYTVTVPTISETPSVTTGGGSVYYDLTIQGINNFTGTKTIKIEACPVTLKYDDSSSKKEIYIKSVTLKADGYVIGFSPSGNFAQTQKYEQVGENQTVDLYVKKSGNNDKIIHQELSGITIKDLQLLFDGSTTQKSYYKDLVVISADGYTIEAVTNKGSTDTISSDKKKYVRRVLGENQSCTITFMDSEGNQADIEITGLSIYEEPVIDIKYNGGAYQEWFNKDVAITSTGYKISEHGVGAYKASYTFTEDGENVKSLDFQDTSDTSNVKTYTIIVRIDRTPPTGSITLKDATSKTFTTKDSVVGYVNSNQSATITSEDELSGADKILYYVSDTFYNSSEDLTASMSEKNAKWRTYSSSSKPTTVKDKNNYIYAAVYDKAGNVAYLSLGNIIYDTVAPTVTTATVTDSADGKSKVLVVAGTDELSGINRFKLMYFEKDNTHQPSKDEIFNMGTYIEASSSSGKEAGATYTISGLESGKTYMFYVASVDRAGNVSDVKAIEGEGTTAAEAAAAKAAADAAAAEAAASSALAAAPNGLAGGNSGQPKTSPEASADSQSGTSGEEEGEEERVISRDPYIADATGSTQIGPINTSGWDKIKSEIKKADNGTQMSVEMSGVSEIPLSVLKEVADRDDLEVTFLINDGVEWTIKGSSITEEGIKTVDLGVKMGSKNIPAKVSNDVVGSYQHVDFAVNEEGELGFTATISVPVGTSNAGMNATLYYYNPEKNELEAVKASIVDDSGRASFDMTHCSDYTIVITPEKLLSDSEVSYSVTRSDTLTSEEIFDGTKIRLADLFGVSGGGRIWLFVIAAISAALCVAILYFPGLQKEEGN